MEGFFGVGFWEILLIFIIIIALLGPRRLPEIAARLGTLIRRVKRASHDLTSELAKEVEGKSDTSGKPFASLDGVKQAASDLASALSRKEAGADKQDDTQKAQSEVSENITIESSQEAKTPGDN